MDKTFKGAAQRIADRDISRIGVMIGVSFSGKSRRGNPVNLISDPSGVPEGF